MWARRKSFASNLELGKLKELARGTNRIGEFGRSLRIWEIMLRSVTELGMSSVDRSRLIDSIAGIEFSFLSKKILFRDSSCCYWIISNVLLYCYFEDKFLLTRALAGLMKSELFKSRPNMSVWQSNRKPVSVALPDLVKWSMNIITRLGLVLIWNQRMEVFNLTSAGLGFSPFR